MEIALNGELPTLEAIQRLHSEFVKGDISVVLFELGEWDEYEENIQWKRLAITFSTGEKLVTAGYTGLWEFLSFDKLMDFWKRNTILDYFVWMEDHMSDDGSYELFEEDE